MFRVNVRADCGRFVVFPPQKMVSLNHCTYFGPENSLTKAVVTLGGNSMLVNARFGDS